MSILGAIDIGTNSTRLLIAEVKDGRIKEILESDLITTRIGEGMATHSTLKKEAIERTVSALRIFKEKMLKYPVRAHRVVATSAVRDAENQVDFTALVKTELDINVDVISGQEEAYLSYLGVANGLNSKFKNTVVVDVGGGSTELIWLQEDKINCESLPVGAVRLAGGNFNAKIITERFLQIAKDIPKQDIHLIGVGGSITTLAAIDLKLEKYDPLKVHGYILSLDKIEKIYKQLSDMSVEQRKQVSGLQPERADIIVYGIRIFDLLLKSLKVDKISVSEADILHGIIFSLEKNIS